MNDLLNEDRAARIARERCAMENRAEAARLIRQSYPEAYRVTFVAPGPDTATLSLAAIYTKTYRRLWDANYREVPMVPLQVERITARLADAYELAPAYIGSEPDRLPHLSLEEPIRASNAAAARRLADRAKALQLSYRDVVNLAEALAVDIDPMGLRIDVFAAINDLIGERKVWEQFAMMAAERAEHLAAVAYLKAPPTTRPELGEGREWAWVTYDEAHAYQASVLANGPGRCCPLFPLDQVERMRRDCARHAARSGPGCSDTLVWIAPGQIAEVSGQWDINGDGLKGIPGHRESDAPAAQVIHEASPDGLYAIGVDWTWRVLRDGEVDPAAGTVWQ